MDKLFSIGFERFQCPEVLFKPNFIGLEQDGIHKLIFSSIMKCDIDINNNVCILSFVNNNDNDNNNKIIFIFAVNAYL